MERQKRLAEADAAASSAFAAVKHAVLQHDGDSIASIQGEKDLEKSPG